jgi:hypothetical protein
MCSTLYVTAAGTVSRSGTVAIGYKWYGDSHANGPSSGAAVNVTTQWASNYAGGSNNPNCYESYVDASSAISWSFQTTGTITSAPTLRYGLTVEFLGP